MRRRKQRSRGQGSLKKRTKHGPYIARWIDHEGRRRERSTRTTDRAAAERILAKLIADVALRRDGVIDPHLDATLNETRRDIADHIADFEARLIAAHRKPKHVAQTIRYIRTIVDAKGWTCAADINADGVNGFAADLRTLGERGRSARTIQAHLTAIKGFTKWLSAHHKLPRDPLVSVTKPNPKVDRRRARRMLLPEEWEWLRAKLVTAAERYRVPAQERMLLYATAIQTGLRAGELRGLKRGQLFLDGDQPYITCKAGRRRTRRMPASTSAPSLRRRFRRTSRRSYRRRRSLRCPQLKTWQICSGATCGMHGASGWMLRSTTRRNTGSGFRAISFAHKATTASGWTSIAYGTLAAPGLR
jgi:site-specific recombinase XerD